MSKHVKPCSGGSFAHRFSCAPRARPDPRPGGGPLRDFSLRPEAGSSLASKLMSSPEPTRVRTRSKTLRQAASAMFAFTTIVPLMILVWTLHRLDALSELRSQVGLGLALAIALLGFYIFRQLMGRMSDLIQALGAVVDRSARPAVVARTLIGAPGPRPGLAPAPPVGAAVPGGVPAAPAPAPPAPSGQPEAPSAAPSPAPLASPPPADAPAVPGPGGSRPRPRDRPAVAIRSGRPHGAARSHLGHERLTSYPWNAPPRDRRRAPARGGRLGANHGQLPTHHRDRRRTGVEQQLDCPDSKWC